MKGPADYIDIRKRKINGFYDTKAPIGAVVGEVQYLGTQTPGTGHYELKTETTQMRSPRADLNRDKSPKKPLRPVVRDDSPSPASYQADNWKKTSSYRNSSFNYSINKAKKQSFFEKDIKAKKNNPGIGQYKSDMDKFLKLSVSPTVAKFKRGR